MSLQTRFCSDPVRFRHWLPLTWLAACMLLAPPGLADDWNPPAPNPAEPANYIAWINKTLGAGVTDNACDRYFKAYKRIKPFEGDWGETLNGPWSDNEEVSAWLEENRTALALFRMATRKRDCFIPLGSGEELLSPDQKSPPRDPRMEDCLITVMLRQLSKHRAAVKGLIAEGYHDWQRGHPVRLRENSLAVLRSAHHLADRCPTLIQHLVAIACARPAYGALRDALRLSDDPDALAAKILPKLKAADPQLPPFAHVIRLESITQLDILQRLFLPAEQEGRWTFHKPILTALVEAMEANESDAEAFAKIASIGFDRTRREVSASYDAMDKWCAAPYHVAAGKADEIVRGIKEHENPFIQMFVPALTRARRTDEYGRAARRATHLIVHLFAHHAKTGSFPDALDQLGAPDLAQVRIDPFSGKDFVYQKTGDSFTLYSVASNLKDDGGKHDPKWHAGDYVFWPVTN